MCCVASSVGLYSGGGAGGRAGEAQGGRLLLCALALACIFLEAGCSPACTKATGDVLWLPAENNLEARAHWSPAEEGVCVLWLPAENIWEARALYSPAEKLGS